MAVDITLTATSDQTADLSTYTFVDQPIGVAVENRDVAVAVCWIEDTTSTLSSATIAGLSATIDVQVGSAAGINPGVAFIRARVPSGTVATVVLNFSTTVVNASIDTYRIVGADPTLADFSGTQGTSSPQATALDVPADGGAIATAGTADTGGAGTFTWTGLTEDTDRTVESALFARSSAHDEFATEQLGLVAQASASGGADTGLSIVGVAFGPHIEEAVGTASGTSTAAGAGVALSFATAEASGAATVSGDGVAVIPAVASASGAATVSGVGFGGLRPAVGSAAGQATVTGIASLLHSVNTVMIQKPVDYALAWRGEGTNAATPGDTSKMSKALLRSIFRE